MNPIIETERIILREFIESDFEAVFEFNSNPEVQKYTGDVILESYEQAKKTITDVWFEDYKKYGYGRWAVIYKPDNKLIGFAGLKYLPELDETDLGYRILPEYWGKGLMTEIGREILKYGFDNLGLNRIFGIAEPENIGSCKVLEKSGLVFYKVDEYIGDGESYNWYKIEKLNFER